MLGPGILDDTAAVEAESSNLSISDDTEVMVDPDDLLEYENLMRSRLPSIPPVDLSYLEDVTTIPQQTEGHGDERTEAEREAEKTMTKAEKQNAKKKRRKERERAMKQMVEDAIGPGRRGETIHAEVEAEKQIPFRLFSSMPVRPLSLLPVKEDYQTPINPRHIPLDSAVTAKIRQAASSAAAAWEDSSRPLDIAPPAQASHPTASTRLEGEMTLAVPLPLISLNLPTPGPTLIHILPSTYPALIASKIKSKGRTVSVLRIPQAPVPEPASTKLSSRKRRRVQAQPYQTQQARYWAPEVGLGGKARGYGYGYRGSEEGMREMGWGYVRS